MAHCVSKIFLITSSSFCIGCRVFILIRLKGELHQVQENDCGVVGFHVNDRYLQQSLPRESEVYIIRGKTFFLLFLMAALLNTVIIQVIFGL